MDISRRRSWMWADALALLDEAERKHRRFFDLMAAPASRPLWEPPADIFADGTEINVVVALPGVGADEVQVQITPLGLQIDAAVPPPNARHRLPVVRLEIPYGRMRRRIDLPAGRYALLEQRLERGCLYLRLMREVP
ncbi:MAG TPA: Hsp20/alpha crystallin family protein [Steroidobacteraceae bacterium]